MKRKLLTLLWVMLALACAGYGFAVRGIGAGTSAYLMWFCLSAVFLFFAFVVQIGLWKKLPALCKKIVLAVFCVGMILFLIVEGCVISGFFQHGQGDPEYIIVLGAQVHESGPSAVLRYRLDRATEYLNEHPDTVCIVSGGQGSNEPFSEAEGMRRYLTAHGIDEARILSEDTSTSTRENIANSMALIPEDATVGIVTNNFHIFRAVQTAKKCGLTNACGIAADASWPYLPHNMLREFFAMATLLFV